MEILVGLIVVLAVAAFLGRDSRSATTRTAVLPVSPAVPRPTVVQDRADDAFIMSYLIARHTADGGTSSTDRHRADAAYDECEQYADDMGTCGGDDGWDEY